MHNWPTGKEAAGFVLFVIKISKIICPITLRSSNFKWICIKVAMIMLFLLLFILTFFRSVMHSVFHLDELFGVKFTR